MGEIIMRNWDLPESCKRVNLPSGIQQVRVPMLCVISEMWGHGKSIRHIVLLSSHIPLYPPYRSQPFPASLSCSCTTPRSSQKTKVSHLCVSIHSMIINQHWVVAYSECSTHRVQHTPGAAYTQCSLHRVQWTPQLVSHPFILTIVSYPLSVASMFSVPPYTDRPPPASPP